MRWPSASGRRRSCGTPSALTSTACSASFGPIARAASRPLAPSASSSFELSGRTTSMEDDKDTQADRPDDRNDELPGSPAPDPDPDPEEQEGAEDDPEAD